jgi:hypothetical protein
MTVRSTDKEILTLVEDLDARSLINGNALVAVLQQLAAGQALTREHLASIFSPETMYQLLGTPVDLRTPPTVRQQALDEITTILMGVPIGGEDGGEELEPWADLVRANLQLVAWLRDLP